MCIHVGVWMVVHIYLCVHYVCMDDNAYILVCVYASYFVHVCMAVHTYMCVCTHVIMCVYAWLHIHTCVYIYSRIVGGHPHTHMHRTHASVHKTVSENEMKKIRNQIRNDRKKWKKHEKFRKKHENSVRRRIYWSTSESVLHLQGSYTRQCQHLVELVLKGGRTSAE